MECSKQPKYSIVSDKIEALISGKELLPGEKLPSERELAEKFGVCSVTASKGLAELVRKGLLVRKVGSGTYVCSQISHKLHSATRRIGFISHIKSNDDWYALSIAGYARRYWGGHDFRCIWLAEGECDYAKLVEEYQLTGVVVIAPEMRHIAKLLELEKQNTSFVVLGVDIPKLSEFCFTPDDVAAGRNAVSYLAGLGHKAVGMIVGYPSSMSAIDRLRGYREGMWREGLATNPDWLIEGEFTDHLPDGDLDRIQQLLSSSNRPSALFLAGHSYVYTVYRAACECGLSIPRDLSIVGFDDPTSAEFISPALTTFRQPLQEVVNDAMAALYAKINDKPSVAPKKYLSELIIRESACKYKP